MAGAVDLWMTTQYTSDMPKVRWLISTALTMPVTKQGFTGASGRADRPVMECDTYEGLDVGSLRLDETALQIITDFFDCAPTARCQQEQLTNGINSVPRVSALRNLLLTLGMLSTGRRGRRASWKVSYARRS